MGMIQSKSRYDILDGLRGIAAVYVVISHLAESYMPTPLNWPQVIGHAHLAVDFFFALSGYVIAYAYDDRWGAMGYWEFFKRRLIRLHPLVIFGSTLGFLMFLVFGVWAFPQMRMSGTGDIAFFFLLSLLMIPCPYGKTAMNLNPFNGPNWSLTYEYVANILYALVFRHFGKRLFIASVAVAGCFSMLLAMNVDVFGYLAGRIRYSIAGGMTFCPAQVYIGFTRLLFPFLLGMLLARLKWRISVPQGFWWCALALTVFVCFPRIGGWGLPPAQQMTSIWNGAFELFALFLVFPLILVMGAGSETGGGKTDRICRFLGELSYPLYMTHYPFIYWHHAWAKANWNAHPVWFHIALALAFLALSILFAWMTYRLFDLPVRRWLSRK
ncbi:MAG: acyltransferase [Kiritimatiellae bacterium]|nr:acyltransferase [Kiritimatiellia bacterium]